MVFYIQLGTGSPFSNKNFLLNILELYLSDLSQRIVTIVLPGPNILPNLIAIRLGKILGPGKTIVTILCDKSDKYNSKMFNKKFLLEKGLPVPSWI